MKEFIDALRKAVEATAYRVLTETDSLVDADSRSLDAKAEDKAWKDVIAVLSSYPEQERPVP